MVNLQDSATTIPPRSPVSAMKLAEIRCLPAHVPHEHLSVVALAGFDTSLKKSKKNV
jgi:hypothetical protein